MVKFALHCYADPNVQLGVSSPGGVSPERRRRRPYRHDDDARHECRGHLPALPISEEHQVVETAAVQANATSATHNQHVKADVRNFSFFYGAKQALKNIN